MKTTIILFFLFTALLVQDQIPYGQEFLVNSYVNDGQKDPAIVTLSDGGFLACWISDEQDSSKRGIYAQRYSNDMKRFGQEFRINSTTEGEQFTPAVSDLNDGGFVACWSTEVLDGSYFGVCAQRYDKNSQEVGEEFQVNTYTKNSQYEPAICGLADGGFVICWTSDYQDGSEDGVYAQRYDKDSRPVEEEFRVNGVTKDYQREADIISLADSGFVICWESSGERDISGYYFDVYAQRYDKSSHKVGEEFRVNTYTLGPQQRPRIANLNDGGFVVCWQSFKQVGSAFGAYAQRYDKNFNMVGDEFRINSYTEDYMMTPEITSLRDGGFMVCWLSYAEVPKVIYGKRYDKDSQVIGKTFRINNYTSASSFGPTMTSLGDSGIVICWQSQTQTITEEDIYAKRFPMEPQHHQLHEFTPIVPNIDETIQTRTPALTWQSATNKYVAYPWEMEYTVYCDTLPDFSTAIMACAESDTNLIFPKLKHGKTWFWKVLAKNYYGDEMWSDVSAFFISHKASVENISNPEQFSILQNYPNPFNPSTTIQFELPESGTVSLKIYDIRGRTVYDSGTAFLAAGQHSRIWNGVGTAGEQVAAGVYLYRVEYQSSSGHKQVMMKKMSLVR